MNIKDLHSVLKRKVEEALVFRMKTSLESTEYELSERPSLSSLSAPLDDFGIYFHVPFCYSFCTFCPFYKEKYSDVLHQKYVRRVIQEIDNWGAEMERGGNPLWIYFGGGTPNTLAAKDIRTLIERIETYVDLPTQIGAEILPAVVSTDYMARLFESGVNRISLGLESEDEAVVRATLRSAGTRKHFANILDFAKKSGVWSNVDVMVGLPRQSIASFTDDMRRLSNVYHPSQITVYPFMVLRNIEATPSMDNETMFEAIEQATKIASKAGYERSGVWTFTSEAGVPYDTSRQELEADYLGFGPGSFSTYGGWKVVNPRLSEWLDSENVAWVAKKRRDTSLWRKFAAQIYDLRIEEGGWKYLTPLVTGLRAIYCDRHGNLVGRDGHHLAHTLTKTVVESLPFPIQNQTIGGKSEND